LKAPQKLSNPNLALLPFKPSGEPKGRPRHFYLAFHPKKLPAYHFIVVGLCPLLL
jgi:hypothetical protein